MTPLLILFIFLIPLSIWGVSKCYKVKAPGANLEITNPVTPRKPPLGIIPHRIWVEERIDELQGALRRYDEASKPIPMTWVSELSDLEYHLQSGEHKKYEPQKTHGKENTES